MSRSRASALLALLLLLAGCGAGSPCDGVGGACIGAHVFGDVPGLAQLLIRVDGAPGVGVRTPAQPGSIRLPAKVALQLHDARKGAVDVAIWGLSSSGATLASVEQSVTLPASLHADADFTLSAHGPAMPGLDGGAGDLAELTPAPDLAPAPGAVTLSGTDPVTVYELNTVHLVFTAIDPQLTALQLSAAGVPATATFTAVGAGATLDWTPSSSEAGSYAIDITATPSDASRAVTQRLTLTVLDTVDPVLDPAAGTPDQLLLQPVGDVNGDGYADLAFCSVTQPASGPPQYSIDIVYGAASGLPTARPYPASRWRNVGFAGATGSHSASAAPVTCIGGDFDGDHIGDVLLADLSYAPTGATPSGAYWVVYGQTAGDSTPVMVTPLSPNSGDVFVAQPPASGDWDGDGVTDFAIMGGSSAAPNLYVFAGGGARTATPSSRVSQPCADAVLLGFSAYVDSMQKHSDLLVWTCGTTGTVHSWLGITGQASPQPSIYLTAAGDSFAICDVDGDGHGDLVVGQAASGQLALSVLFGSTNVSWPALGASTPTTTIAFGGDRPRYACWRTAHGSAASTLAVGDTEGSPTGDGYTAPGVIHLVAGAGRALSEVGTLGNYDAGTMWSGWGQSLSSAGDLNGDSKPDVIVGYQTGDVSAQPQASVVYGR